MQALDQFFNLAGMSINYRFPDPALVDASSEALPMDLPFDRSSIRSEA
jgi:hypothetical protein